MRSGHKFAHDTTAVLLCYMQICDLVVLWKWIISAKKILTMFKLQVHKIFVGGL